MAVPKRKPVHAPSRFVTLMKLREHDARDKSKNTHPSLDPLVIVTAFIFLATCATCVLAYLQWSTLEKTDETLRRTSDASNLTQRVLQRPWISPTIKIASDLTFDANGGYVTFDYVLKNVGHSAAFNVNAFPAVDVIDLKTSDPNRSLEQHCSRMKSNISKLLADLDHLLVLGHAIFPGQEVPASVPVIIPVAPPPPSPEPASSDNASTRVFLLKWCVDYQSSYEAGIHHQTAEAFYFRRVKGNLPVPADARERVKFDDLTLVPAVRGTFAD